MANPFDDRWDHARKVRSLPSGKGGHPLYGELAVCPTAGRPPVARIAATIRRASATDFAPSYVLEGGQRRL